MRKTIVVPALIFAAALAVPAAAQTQSVVAGTAPGMAGAAQTTEVSAKVTAVNAATREVTLKGPKGNEVTVVAGPEVKNFAQIKKGDKVVVSYYRGIAARVAPPGTVASKDVEALDLATAAKLGEKPAAGVGTAVKATVVIEKVDPKANTVTFTRPDGSSRTLPVQSDEGKQFIQKLKKGDTVDVVYAEAVAVEVREK